MRRRAILLRHREALPLLGHSTILESLLFSSRGHDRVVEEDGEHDLARRAFNFLVHLGEECVQLGQSLDLPALLPHLLHPVAHPKPEILLLFRRRSAV